MTPDRADDVAFARMNAVRPMLTGTARFRELTGADERLLLHAGPPFDELESVPVPVLNSLATVTIREGWADSAAEAVAMIRRAEIRIAPAQDHGILVPLAGVVGPSTALLVVSDAADPGRRRMSPINEGMTLCTRTGNFDPALPGHLRWLDGPVAEWIGSRLALPIDLHPVVRAALAAGDDCHARTVAGSEALVELLVQRPGRDDPDGAIRDFLRSSPAFALNVWMAMCAVMTAAAEGCAGSALVTRAGGNGTRFGYQIAAQPGRWITLPAPPIRGRIEPTHNGRRAAPALGDSALVDFMGLGGQALDAAPLVRAAMADLIPDDAARRPGLILHGRLDGFGRRGVTNATRAAAVGVGPMILLGMIDAAGQAGRIGGGSVALDGPAMAASMRSV